VVTVAGVPLGVGCVAVIDLARPQWHAVAVLALALFSLSLWRSRRLRFLGPPGVLRFERDVVRLGERLARADVQSPPLEPPRAASASTSTGEYRLVQTAELQPHAFEASGLVVSIRLRWGEHTLCWSEVGPRHVAHPLLALGLGSAPDALVEPRARGFGFRRPAAAAKVTRKRAGAKATDVTEGAVVELLLHDELEITLPNGLTASVSVSRAALAVGPERPAAAPLVAFALAAALVLGCLALSARLAAPRAAPGEVTLAQLRTMHHYLGAASEREQARLEAEEAERGPDDDGKRPSWSSSASYHRWLRRNYDSDRYLARYEDEAAELSTMAGFLPTRCDASSWGGFGDPLELRYSLPGAPPCVWGDCSDGALRTSWPVRDCSNVGRFGLQVDDPARLSGWGVDYAAYRPPSPDGLVAQYAPFGGARARTVPLRRAKRAGVAPRPLIEAALTVSPSSERPRYQAAQWERLAAVHVCAEGALSRNPKLSGQLFVVCRPSASGDCRELQTSATLVDSELIECARRAHEGRYPAPDESSVVVFRYEIAPEGRR
jgi:hypothetical protein